MAGVQQREPVVGETGIVAVVGTVDALQAELGALAVQQMAAIRGRERIDHPHRLGHRLSFVVAEQRQQALGQARQVPARDARLVAERVAALAVDRAEHRRRVVRLDEGARAVVDGLARDRHVVGVHDAVDEADVHPLRDQHRLALGDALEQGEEAARRADEIGVVTGDRVLGELAHALGIAAGGEELERADTDVARRDARQNRAGQHRLAQHRLAGGDDGERARGRDAERMHRLADEDLAQHRPDRRLAVAAARERRPARALQRDVAALAGAVDHFAEQDRAAIAELRREAAELMPGIDLRDRLGTFGHLVAGEDIGAGRARQRGDVEAELIGERRVEEERLRRRRRFRSPRDGEALEITGVGVLEAEGGDGRHGATCGWRESERLRAAMPRQGR